MTCNSDSNTKDLRAFCSSAKTNSPSSGDKEDAKMADPNCVGKNFLQSVPSENKSIGLVGWKGIWNKSTGKKFSIVNIR